MEQYYNNMMVNAGYNHLVCDIFSDWENVKDEILPQERKSGSGNGTIHVFLGAANKELQKEFSNYYEAVTNNENPSVGAVPVKHYFLVGNLISALGYLCNFYFNKNVHFEEEVKSILETLKGFSVSDGLVTCDSLFKLSIGQGRLRPYFKQFDPHGVFSKVVRRLLLPNSCYKISLYKKGDNEYAAFWLIGFAGMTAEEIDADRKRIESSYKSDSNDHLESILHSLPRQLIYYGAPGTGKSFRINEMTIGNDDVIRTTFHPDSDYSTFVGAYKPTMKSFKRSDHGYMLDGDGHEREREEITYEFVPQAFLQAYVQAWTLLANATSDNDIKPEFLVIEEINRGNCAQIFGDLFQLLDRGEEGFSDYPIHADKDLQGYLRKKFAESLTNKDEQNANLVRAYGNEDRIKRLLDGEILLLPCNLYIWATMNTSDQSLFPIDSAFKRRWDWKYVPISKGKDKTGTPLQWKIQVNGKQFDWWSFLQKINDRIYKATESEDKQLGFFFCKADRNGIITAERFVNKVIFYLWNDVFKDYDTKGVFPDAYATFDKFFTGEGDANEIAVETFLTGLKVEQTAPEAIEQPAEPQEDNAE